MFSVPFPKILVAVSPTKPSTVPLHCYLWRTRQDSLKMLLDKVIIQVMLFQRYTHLLYCSVLSLSGYVNTRRMSQPDMESIFHIKNQWNILVIGNYYVNLKNVQNSMVLSSSGTKRTLMHRFWFTNSAQRELVSICTQSIRNCN